MNRSTLPDFLLEKYKELKPSIIKRLQEFSEVPEVDYFYELCYCICTPQSKAKSAFHVQNQLKELNFRDNDFDPTSILRTPGYYIRFHNQKAKRLIKAKNEFENILNIIKFDDTSEEKRIKIYKSVDGFGLKESAHFLRNIGFRNLAILDRHILKHLVNCGLYHQVPKIGSEKQYRDVENSFKNFAERIKIPIDELDLLFWSYETGEILK